MPDNYSLGANDNGMVRINRQPMSKGELRPYQYAASDGTEYSRLQVNDHDGNVLIPSTPYGEIIDDSTGDPFASEAALQTFVEENFFNASNGGGAINFTEYNTVTGDYTLQLSDAGKIVRVDTTGGDANITVPADVFSDKDILTVRNIGTNTASLLADTGVTLNAATLDISENGSAVLHLIGSSNEWDVYGGGSGGSSTVPLVDIGFTGPTVSTVSGATGTSSTDTFFGHLGIGDKSLAAFTDGHIQAQFVPGHGDVVLQLSTSSSALGFANAANKIGIDINGTTGDVYVLEGGAFSNSSSPVGSLASGNIIAIFRAGSGFLIKKSIDGGATFTPTSPFTPTITSTAQLFPSVDCKGVNTAIIDNVKASGFA